MATDETLSETAERLAPVLGLVLDGLRDAVIQAAADHEAHGYKATQDPAFLAASVRRFLRERLTPAFPGLAQTSGNMSPIHLDLGRDQLKVLHAREGEMPQAQSDARKEFYGINDSGQLAFDYEGGTTEPIILRAFVLAWASEGPDLIQATLFKPSRDLDPAEIDLLGIEIREEDLDISLPGEEGGRAVGDDNGPDTE